MRFLFVVPPFTGHVNPTIGVALELERRGHEVAWAGVPGATEALLPPGARFLSAVPDEVASYVAEAGERRPDARGAAAFKFLMEDVLLPLADHMVDGVDAAVDAFGADVLVVDQQALGGAVAARRRGLPWATSATTSAELVDPLAMLPKVADAMHQLRVDLQVRHGIAPDVAAAGDLRLSPHLVLAYTVADLTGPLEGTPAGEVPVAFVGPCAVGRPEPGDFPWERLADPAAGDDRPNVLVSLGTLNAEVSERFWLAAADAFRDQPWVGVFVAPDHLVPDPPPNVIVRGRVPQLDLLPRLSAVVSHAGHNTVCETLAAGLPLVVAPIRDDQPVVADQVVRAGAAVRVKFARVRAEDLRAAISAALHDDELRSAAGRIRAGFAAAGGPPAAADALERLAP